MPSTKMKPIKLYGHWGVEPSKVAVILGELKLPYEIELVESTEVKSPEYTAINPNGRLPAIHDPNTGLTLWESGPIMEYLVEKYDTARTLSFRPGSNEWLCATNPVADYHAKQYLAYQISGQGPCFENVVYFLRFSDDPNPDAVARFIKETKRVAAVLESVLSDKKKNGGEPWLVGNRISYADLSFLGGFHLVTIVAPRELLDLSDYPVLREWLDRIGARKAVRETYAKFRVI
ncbi:glutathione S-transferase Ure2-like protein [Xylariaceae sp. FL0255]|nr:glutathione S-transferase Ure2-like protein [Xylariaceae sp. FL0255]